MADLWTENVVSRAYLDVRLKNLEQIKERMHVNFYQIKNSRSYPDRILSEVNCVLVTVCPHSLIASYCLGSSN